MEAEDPLTFMRGTLSQEEIFMQVMNWFSMPAVYGFRFLLPSFSKG